MGESKNGPLRVDFDRRLKLEFQGSKVTSDGGLLAYRELDDALGLAEAAASVLEDGRRGRNGWHATAGMLRQSVFGRLAGYEDVNDAERLSRDPAMRWIVGGKATDRGAASSSQMGRFETQWLTADANLTALSALSGLWIDRVHRRKPTKLIILDMDSSVSPAHGDQEGTAYNGHFGCTCYHPRFVFNQLGDLERCALRPGNVHSADGWREVLDPVVARYRDRKLPRYFRGDAAFASPDIYEYLEAEGFGYAIRLPANSVLQGFIAHLLRRPRGRPPMEVRRYFASFSYRAGSWTKARRVVAKVEWHPGELYPRVGFVVTNLSRPAERIVAFYNQRGTAEQHIKEGKNAIRWTRLSCRRFKANAVRLQLHALAYNLGNIMRTLALPDPVSNWTLTTLREQAGQYRGKGREPWPLRHLPIGRGRCAACSVRRHPGSDRPLATTANTGVSQRYANQNYFTTGDLCPERYEIGTGPWFSDQWPMAWPFWAVSQTPMPHRLRSSSHQGNMDVMIGRCVGDPSLFRTNRRRPC